MLYYIRPRKIEALIQFISYAVLFRLSVKLHVQCGYHRHELGMPTVHACLQTCETTPNQNATCRELRMAFFVRIGLNFVPG